MRLETGRNPFARETIRKRKHEHKTRCDFCGSSNSRGWVWQYYADADAPRASGDIYGGFCSIGCLNAWIN